jgi:DNA-binding CsgD family transcriptional regulator
MLDIKQQQSTSSSSAYDQDRNRVIQSMASGGMDPLEIARQMGMTREEVDMVIRLGRR